MLAVRIIPTLLVRNGQLVKGKQFKDHRTVGVPLQAIRIYAARGVDELLYLDIGATPQSKPPDFDFVRSVSDGLFCPLSIGGGIKAVDDITKLLAYGADKVVIGATALSDPGLIQEASERFGKQALVASINYKEEDKDSLMEAPPENLAIYMESLGFGEIILNCIDRDGMMQGYDLETIESVSNSVSIPVIASGGCGTYEHMYEAIQAGASAVAASSIFLFTDQTPRGAAEYLAKKGIEVRL